MDFGPPPKGGEMNVPASDLPEQKKERLDFRDSFHWRIFRIMAEFVDGFQFLADLRKSVSFFGSAVLPESHPWYQQARKLASMLVREGYTVITGGGPGIMEAANRGASEASGDNTHKSIGLNIELTDEQRRNPYVQRGPGFHYFFTRKVMLSYASQSYIFFPGGLGTLDEFFEITTLIQTKKIDNSIPVILVGKEYWQPFVDWIEQYLYEKHRTIDQDDTKIYTLVDTVEEALEIVRKSKERTELYEELCDYEGFSRRGGKLDK